MVHVEGIDDCMLALQTDYNLLSAKRNKSFLERLKDIPRIAAVFWILKTMVDILFVFARKS